MIVCVTLNPCLDKTLLVPDWTFGDDVRGSSLREVVGGKGNNVARALKRLGRAARPATFLGGPVGSYCEELMRRDDGFDPLVTPTDAPTRVILTVRPGRVGGPEPTAFFDPDPSITLAEAENLLHRVEGALTVGDVEALTLSGSSPSPATHALFSDLIALARARRVPIFLDTYGPALAGIWGFWPDVIQLNRKEASGALKDPEATDAEIWAYLARLSRHGMRLCLVTDGPNPAFVQAGPDRFRVRPAPIEVVNPIGSGDSLLAGIVDGWLSGLNTEAMIRRGFACAASNASVWDAGAIDPVIVDRLAPDVVIEGPGAGPSG